MKVRHMRRAIFCLTLGVLSLAGCGDDDPTGLGLPDLVGNYEGSWTVTVEGPGLEPTIELCAGTVTVTEQSAEVFEGTFSQAAGGECEAGTGFVTGAVTADGAVTILLGASGGGGPGFEESTGCTLLSAESSYTGFYSADVLSFETSLTARCPETGDLVLTWTYAFEGS
ncbi:MAG: hypothetical protein P8049_04230 [Gemmatimonadota bacterium]